MTAACSSNNNAQTAAAAHSQKSFLTRRLCIFILFWSVIEPTPFVLMVFSCAALPGFHNRQTHLPPSFSHLSPCSLLISVWDLIIISKSLSKSSLSVHTPASSC